MKFEHTEVMNFENAIRGMRNAWESWDKSDSRYIRAFGSCFGSEPKYHDEYIIGDNDLELMQKLIKAGSEHRKFMRQIFVSVDITAPIYWWKEFDTYKVGTVANSTGTMHTLARTPITMDCFEMDDFAKSVMVEDNSDDRNDVNMNCLWDNLICCLEQLRETYNETKDKRYWKELIRLLPESWLQKRTVTMNYENLLAMVHQRKGHKLTEWSKSFIDWVRTLPYAEDLIFQDEQK